MGYLANRFVLKPYVPNTFSIGYFNDVICVPFCLPVMLWGMRKTRLRKHDLPPQPAEVMISLFIWAVSFELLIPALPFFRARVVADPVDILCYVAGALLATLVWRWWYGGSVHRPPSAPATPSAD